MSANLAASIRARLKNRADARGQDFNQVLTHFGLERLLYRLSISPHANNFLLKGALLFMAWQDLPQRPTRDADLLGFGADDVDTVAAVFADICRIVVDDGIEFEHEAIRASVIRKDAGYGGVRILLRATLNRARIDLQIDIGFGDVVTPEPDAIRYPVLLDDFSAPQLRAYPRYTVIAEKLQALCVLGLANSRMKDYFDLWILTRDASLDMKVVAQAIAATFARRRTEMPLDWPIGLRDSFAEDSVKQIQWQAFLRKSALTAPSLALVVQELRERLLEPLEQARGSCGSTSANCGRNSATPPPRRDTS